eukprot:scaffold109652_cov55-Attheya_sp.AAC.1
MSQDKKHHNTLANTATNHGHSAGSDDSHGHRRPLRACPPYRPLHTRSPPSLITSYLIRACHWSFARCVGLSTSMSVVVRLFLWLRLSHAMHTTGILLGGVCLIIMALLALGSDQVVKLHSAIQEFGSVKYFHLYEYRDYPTNMAAILHYIDALPTHTTATIFLFCLPQTIQHDSNVRNTLLHAHLKSILKSVFLDEVHLYVEYTATPAARHSAILGGGMANLSKEDDQFWS